LKGLEWLTTWKKYLSDNKIITNDEINQLFSTVIDNIKNMSDIFLADITKLHENWTRDSEVGGIYNKIAPFFSMYVDYCNNNENAGKTLGKLMTKNKRFKQYIEDQEKLAGQPMESYLITPIQRIPRYEMLINQALKYTHKDSSDYTKLKEASNKVRDV